jgi:hypothetical protein
MWNICKAEFRYVAFYIILVSVCITGGFLFYFRIKESGTVSGMLFPLTVAIILQLLMHRSIEKRDRQIAVLPLSIRHISLARIGLFLVPVMLLHIVYMIFYLIFKSENPRWSHDFYDVLMFFGLALLGSSLYFIQHDLLYTFSVRKRNPEIDIIILIILLTALFLAIPLALAPVWGVTGNMLRLLCFLAGLASLYPAVMAYERRRSYVE